MLSWRLFLFWFGEIYSNLLFHVMGCPSFQMEFLQQSQSWRSNHMYGSADLCSNTDLVFHFFIALMAFWWLGSEGPHSLKLRVPYFYCYLLITYFYSVVNEWGFPVFSMLHSSPPLTCDKADLTSSARWDQSNRVVVESVAITNIFSNIKC